MAHIDELVKRVADPQLREALAEQVRTLVDRKEFGLVFQHHLPETVRLPQQRVRTGDKVQLRDDRTSKTYRAVSVKPLQETALAILLDDTQEPVGEPVEIPLGDLVVVKEFGEPVYPGLRLVGEAGLARPDQPSHVVINGENFHALQALQYTHSAKVDLIYIDPPYNTGAADWKYNDRYVDGSDAYRHSKWLSFMERRLRLAKELLKDTGVLVLAIDDNEHHRVRMLADQVFGETNFLANVTWQGGVKNDARFGGGGIDYMLVYGKSSSALVAADVRWKDPKRGIDDVLTAGHRAWQESGGDAQTATQIFKQWWKATKPDVDPGTRLYNEIDEQGRIFRKGDMTSPNYRKNLVYEVLHPVTGLAVPTPKNGWRVPPETMQERIAAGEVSFGKDEKTVPQAKRFLSTLSTQVPKMVFEVERTAGTNHLANVLGDRRFPFPKDHRVLMRWFRMIAPKDAVIVDFFAGSGTTAEAVARLNEEDGGTRQCILVTNNEVSKAEDAKLRKSGIRPGDEEYEALGVFHHVTKPRLMTVLTGVRENGSSFSDSIDGQHAAFFDLTYEDENMISLGRRFEAIAPLLWLQAGSTGPIIDKPDPSGFVVRPDATYAVIFDTSASAAAVEAMHPGVGMVFIVTDSEAEFRMVVAGLPRRLQGTAQHLYASYLRSFEINRI